MFQKSNYAQIFHVPVQNRGEIPVIMSFVTHLNHTNHVVRDLFNVLNNHKTFKLHRMGVGKQQQQLFAVYVSDTPIYYFQTKSRSANMASLGRPRARS